MRRRNKPVHLSVAEARKLGLISAEKSPLRRPAQRRPATKKTTARKRGATKGQRKGFRLGSLFGRGVKTTGRAIGRGARSVARGSQAVSRGFLFGLRRNPASKCQHCRKRQDTIGMIDSPIGNAKVCKSCQLAVNPHGQHLPKLGPKFQRMYEDILRTGRARYGKRAKEVAARTVEKRAHQNSGRVRVTRPEHLLRAILGSDRVKELSKTVNGRRRTNPKFGETFNLFHGRPSERTTASVVSKRGTGRMDQLGSLRHVILRNGKRIRFNRSAKLAADGRGRLWLAGVRFPRPKEVKNPDEFALVDQISQVEYETTKSHMDGKPTIYYHDFERPLPTLYLDHEGFPVIDGGGYRIKEEGIVG